VIAEPCSPEALAAGGFRVAEGGKRWVSLGPVTFANAGAVLESTRTMPLPDMGVVDCGALHPVDSAGLAVLLAIKRRALAEGIPVVFTNITPSLHTLADLYGVEGLLAA
jgi:ABC-type transporter Mla MlaB component